MITNFPVFNHLLTQASNDVGLFAYCMWFPSSINRLQLLSRNCLTTNLSRKYPFFDALPELHNLLFTHTAGIFYKVCLKHTPVLNCDHLTLEIMPQLK